jgi:hypothetical protein
MRSAFKARVSTVMSSALCDTSSHIIVLASRAGGVHEWVITMEHRRDALDGVCFSPATDAAA